MDEESFKRYEEELERIKKQKEKDQIKQIRTKQIKNKFNSMRVYFDEYSYIIIRDSIVVPGEPLLQSKIYLAGVAVYILLYIAFAFILGRICSLFVPILYLTTLYYDQDNSGIAKCLFGIWVITKLIKILFLKEPKQGPYEAMMYQYKKPTDWYNIFKGSGFYIDMAMLIGLTYLVHKEEYGKMFHGVWIMVSVMVFARNIPGVGGNSNLGLITLIFVASLAFLMLPDIYARMLTITVKTLEPKRRAEDSLGVAAPVGNLFQGLYNPFEPIFGLSATSFLDTIRAGCGNFITGWVILDDWCGAGYALSTATMIRMKGKDEKIMGTAGLYGGVTVFWVIGDLYLSVRAGAVLRVVITIVSILASAAAWFSIGSKVWGGRGQGVMMTEARANFGFVFGSGPIGMRRAVLVCCNFVATMCFISQSDGNVALGMVFLLIATSASERATTIMLGCLTMQLSLIIQGITKVKPLTESLSNATVDAYSSTGENSGSRGDPG